jgi:hypothetical protein
MFRTRAVWKCPSSRHTCHLRTILWGLEVLQPHLSYATKNYYIFFDQAFSVCPPSVVVVDATVLDIVEIFNRGSYERKPEPFSRSREAKR